MRCCPDPPQDYISGEVNHFEGIYNSSSGNRTALFAAINATNIPDVSVKASLDSSMAGANAANAEIDDIMLSGTGSIKELFGDLADELRKLKADADDGLGSVQDARYDANIAIILFIMFAGCCAVLAVAAPSVKESFRTMTKAYCLSSCCVICMLLFTMIIAAVYLFITTLVADVCYDPKGWMVKAMNVPDDAASRDNQQNMSSYYIECGGYDAARRESAWPLAADMAEVAADCETINASTTEISTILDDNGLLPTTGPTLVANSVQADTEMCTALVGEAGLLVRAFGASLLPRPRPPLPARPSAPVHAPPRSRCVPCTVAPWSTSRQFPVIAYCGILLKSLLFEFGRLDGIGHQGWQGVVKCAVINELYEQVLFDICEDLFNPIALM